MNLAILLAGSTVQRLGAGKPKQFVGILGKPVMVYAMEIHEKSLLLDAIEVVCVAEYKKLIWQ